MNQGVGTWRCVKCHEHLYPQRLLCPGCHGDKFEQDRIYRAVVEEVSTIRHMIGQSDWEPRRIASVRMADGLRITVGLLDQSGPGAVVELIEEEGAPFGYEKRMA
jgi:hypothetical protein